MTYLYLCIKAAPLHEGWKPRWSQRTTFLPGVEMLDGPSHFIEFGLFEQAVDRYRSVEASRHRIRVGDLQLLAFREPDRGPKTSRLHLGSLFFSHGAGSRAPFPPYPIEGAAGSTQITLWVICFQRLGEKTMTKRTLHVLMAALGMLLPAWRTRLTHCAWPIAR